MEEKEHCAGVFGSNVSKAAPGLQEESAQELGATRSRLCSLEGAQRTGVQNERWRYWSSLPAGGGGHVLQTKFARYRTKMVVANWSMAVRWMKQ